jgi:hypothetical protein
MVTHSLRMRRMRKQRGQNGGAAYRSAYAYRPADFQKAPPLCIGARAIAAGFAFAHECLRSESPRYKHGATLARKMTRSSA